MKVEIDWKHRYRCYESVWPPYRWWSLRSLFDKLNWCFPGNGYRQAIPALWNNLMVFLTPWYRPFRQLMSTFANENDMKLLDYSRYYTHLRTRGERQRYYTLRRRRLLWAELEEMRCVDTRTGEPVNVFGAGMLAFFRGDTVEETEARYREERDVVCRGFIMTKAGCQRMLDRIVGLTEGKIDWFGCEDG